jgi:hypothetical protein
MRRAAADGVPVDSRWHAVAYAVRRREELPEDFDADAVPEFRTAVFLPRDDPDQRGQSAYPPRVVALAGGSIAIVAHPSAKEAVEELRFERIRFVESGQILLSGWLRFVGPDLDRTLAYNTRGWRAVDGFLREFRGEYLPAGEGEAHAAVKFGPPLDLKFRNALAGELDAGERVEAALFRAPRRLAGGGLLRRRRLWAPGDLLALTNRRLLWITDRDGGACARYGRIARYARIGCIEQVVRERVDGEGFLRVGFGAPEAEWRIPVSEDQWQDAGWFEGIRGRRDGERVPRGALESRRPPRRPTR